MSYEKTEGFFHAASMYAENPSKQTPLNQNSSQHFKHGSCEYRNVTVLVFQF